MWQHVRGSLGWLSVTLDSPDPNPQEKRVPDGHGQSIRSWQWQKYININFFLQYNFCSQLDHLKKYFVKMCELRIDLPIGRSGAKGINAGGGIDRDSFDHVKVSGKPFLGI